MEGQSRKWMILVVTIWIQAFTGTNFDFSAYSSELKSVLGISQVQLNYLATASDLGKAIGWSSGLALMWLPLWAVMFAAAAMGLVGYGVQWLVICNVIALPYFMVFLLCMLAGCSICWFNTFCFVLCTKNFPSNRPLALALTVSFNGVSAALYNLAVKSLSYPPSTSLYLLLNALLPLFTSIIALIPILSQSCINPLTSDDDTKRDQLTFLKLNFLAIITGLYLLFLHPLNSSTAIFLFAGAIFFLILPLGIPVVIYVREWLKQKNYSSFPIDGSGFILVDDEDLELRKEPVLIDKEKLFMLGEEHNVRKLTSRLDFWLYYLAYFCGGTIGLVYSNNLGQIAQSLGHHSMNSKLITIYSSFSFFGRLLSAAPDFIRTKAYFARTGWLAIALIPTPITFFLLAAFGDDQLAVQVATALIGLSSGFIFAAAVSITAELFGPNRVGVNHNILITNIPIGSLAYGFLAAIVYDSNSMIGLGFTAESIVCMGRKCYFLTFVWWGCISLVGISSSFLLFLRTRLAYDRFEQSRRLTVLD